MRILVDIDNVLNNFSSYCVQLFNLTNGTNFSDKDILSYDIAKSLGISSEQFVNQYLKTSETVNSCLPYKDACIYLKKLNEEHEVYIVTARDWCQTQEMENWFKQNYPCITNSQIIRCCNKRLVSGDVLIDDCLDNILNFPTGRILFDYPYNRNIEDITNFIYRVGTWKDCYNVIKLLSGK